jgi:hypothetical protein
MIIMDHLKSTLYRYASSSPLPLSLTHEAMLTCLSFLVALSSISNSYASSIAAASTNHTRHKPYLKAPSRLASSVRVTCTYRLDIIYIWRAEGEEEEEEEERRRGGERKVSGATSVV